MVKWKVSVWDGNLMGYSDVLCVWDVVYSLYTCVLGIGYTHSVLVYWVLGILTVYLCIGY